MMHWSTLVAGSVGVAIYVLLPDSPPSWLRMAWSLTGVVTVLAIGRQR